MLPEDSDISRLEYSLKYGDENQRRDAATKASRYIGIAYVMSLTFWILSMSVFALSCFVFLPVIFPSLLGKGSTPRVCTMTQCEPADDAPYSVGVVYSSDTGVDTELIVLDGTAFASRDDAAAYCDEIIGTPVVCTVHGDGHGSGIQKAYLGTRRPSTAIATFSHLAVLVLLSTAHIIYSTVVAFKNRWIGIPGGAPSPHDHRLPCHPSAPPPDMTTAAGATYGHPVVNMYPGYIALKNMETND